MARTIEALMAMGARLEAKVHTAVVGRAFGRVGSGVSIGRPLRAANLSLVALGDGVTIHSHCWIHALRLTGDDGSPKVIMGDRVCIGMNATISAARRIEFGPNVFTARNVYVSDHGHEFRDVSRPIADQGIGDIAEVRIGADTWLGQNVVVLPGVVIGRHCVIGANSVVNRSIPDFSVAVGAPARVVRTYDFDSRTWKRVDS